MDTKRCYLRTMKTGSTFVVNAIERFKLPVVYAPGLNLDYAASAAMFGGDYQCFTVVRNPLTWYQSFWRFRMKNNEWGGDLVIGHPPFANDNFEDFVATVTQQYPGFLCEYFGRYAKPGVKVLRTETLLQDLAAMFSEPRILELPRANVSSYPCEHTEQTVKLIQDAERETFEAYGYDNLLVAKG